MKVPTDLAYLNLVRGPHDSPPKLSSCWRDLYYSIVEARHLICITGWSVWTELRLFRGEDAANIYSGTLGELLCRKADNGLKVFVMIWSEYSSGGKFGDEGIMKTYDMDTFKYFEDPSKYNQANNRVHCALAPRAVTRSKTWATDHLQNTFASQMYTHHQKTVVMDAPNPRSTDKRRRLIAFVGGLDLTGGRYDTPEHELFSTLRTDHDGDFRNRNIKKEEPTSEHIGPREPWHDIHSKVEGPVAKDVLMNFIERWRQQGTRESAVHYRKDSQTTMIEIPTPEIDEEGVNETSLRFSQYLFGECPHYGKLL